MGVHEKGKANSAKSLPPVGKQNAVGFGFGQIIHSHRSPRPRAQAPCTVSREEPAAGAKLSAALPPPSLEMPQSQQPRDLGCHRQTLPACLGAPAMGPLSPPGKQGPKEPGSRWSLRSKARPGGMGTCQQSMQLGGSIWGKPV